MRRKKENIAKEAAPKYVPRVDNSFYFNAPRKRKVLTPTPWRWKPNYQYIIDFLKMLHDNTAKSDDTNNTGV